MWELGGGGSVRGRLLTNINSSLRFIGPNFERTLPTERILASANGVWVPVYVLKEMTWTLLNWILLDWTLLDWTSSNCPTNSTNSCHLILYF